MIDMPSVSPDETSGPDYAKYLTVDLGGYRLTKYKEMAGNEGMCFSATITKDGKDVLTVSNDGNGGNNRYSTYGAEYKALLAQANAWADYVGEPSPRFEVEDSFVEYLIECSALSRMRAVAFIDGDQNPFDPNDGRYFRTGAGVLRETVVRDLAKSPAHKSPRVWDKTTWRFEPVTR